MQRIHIPQWFKDLQGEMSYISLKELWRSMTPEEKNRHPENPNRPADDFNQNGGKRTKRKNTRKKKKRRTKKTKKRYSKKRTKVNRKSKRTKRQVGGLLVYCMQCYKNGDKECINVHVLPKTCPTCGNADVALWKQIHTDSDWTQYCAK